MILTPNFSCQACHFGMPWIGRVFGNDYLHTDEYLIDTSLIILKIHVEWLSLLALIGNCFYDK